MSNLKREITELKERLENVNDEFKTLVDANKELVKRTLIEMNTEFTVENLDTDLIISVENVWDGLNVSIKENRDKRDDYDPIWCLDINVYYHRFINHNKQYKLIKLTRHGIPNTTSQIEIEKSLLTDYVKQTGWYSAFKLMAEGLYELYDKKKKLIHKLSEVKSLFEISESNKRKELFFNVIKPGNIIKLNYNRTYVIQKINRVNIQVILFDGKPIKKSIKKDVFFNEVEKFVDLNPL